MKNIIGTILLLLLAVTGFAQAQKPTGSTTPKQSTTHSSTGSHARVNSAISPETAATIKKIDDNMVKIPGGAFMMGCDGDKDSSCYYWEKPVHRVTLSSFYMNKFPVTQKEWEVIVGTKPWLGKDCPDCPVETVSWYDAQVFINTLNQLTGRYYRLPTEAEWEYAAGGGTNTHGYPYSGSSVLSVVAWYESNSSKQTHPVGQKLPNELGLYDMSGNVWQWCQDWFDDKYYTTGPSDNPLCNTRDAYRACRGGSWWSEAKDCRVVNRDRYPPDARDDDVGFRLVKE